jgi:hypothetical protein
MVRGGGHVRTAKTFSESIATPSTEIIWLRYCDRTPSNNEGFVSQDHIGGFSTKRECANTHE